MLPKVEPMGVSLDASLKVDYRAVVLRLTYAQLQDKTFALVFGLAEFIPIECPPQEAWPTDPANPKLGVFKNGQRRVYYRRFVLTVEEFLSWWEQAGRNNLFIPQAPKRIPLATDKLQHEPDDLSWNLSSQWPYFANTHNALSEVLQYRTRYWATTKPTNLIAELKTLLEVESVQSGLRALMGDRFGDIQPPWLGSLHVMAPNPIYRSLKTTLQEHDSDEFIRVQVMPRDGSDISTLKLLVNEVRPTGFGSVHLGKIEHLDFLLKRPGGVEQIAVTVLCEKRGSLEAHSPMNFAKRINLQIGHVHKELHIQTSIDKSGENAPFVQRLVEYTDTQVGGGPSDTHTLLACLHASRRTREKKNLGNQIRQTLFYEQHAEAIKFLGERIKRAQISVRLLDPYLSAEDFLRFATFAESQNIKYEAVTAGHFLAKVDKEQKEKGLSPERWLSHLLQSQIQKNYGQHFTHPIQISVLTGNPSPIHDRFLIVDECVWHLGSSFNSIGKSASMVCKVADSDLALVRLNAIVESRSLSLADWLTEHYGAESKTWKDGLFVSFRKTNRAFRRIWGELRLMLKFPSSKSS